MTGWWTEPLAVGFLDLLNRRQGGWTPSQGAHPLGPSSGALRHEAPQLVDLGIAVDQSRERPGAGVLESSWSHRQHRDLCPGIGGRLRRGALHPLSLTRRIGTRVQSAQAKSESRKAFARSGISRRLRGPVVVVIDRAHRIAEIADDKFEDRKLRVLAVRRRVRSIVILLASVTSTESNTSCTGRRTRAGSTGARSPNTS